MPQVSMKASNATSASFLVSAIQISCSARLAFACWLLGSLLRTLAVLCTQQRWPRVFGHTSSIACQKPSAPSATASSGAIESPRRFKSRRSSFQDCALSEEGRPKAPVASNLTLTITMSRDAAFPWKEVPRYLIRDRDAIYGAAVTRRLRAMGIRDKPIAPGSPWQNPYVERLIGTIRRECLDHMIVFGQAHLRRNLGKFAAYYKSRIHRSLDKDAPFHRAIERVGAITSQPVLGGL